MRIQDKYAIVLFDGVCYLCNSSANFILKNDTKNCFKLGTLQENSGKNLVKSYLGKEIYLNSVILIQGDKVFTKSRAALEIARNLRQPWPLFYIFRIVPSFLRDPLYSMVAKNRYYWFGKRDTCRLPSVDEQQKFLAESDIL